MGVIVHGCVAQLKKPSDTSLSFSELPGGKQHVVWSVTPVRDVSAATFAGSGPLPSTHAAHLHEQTAGTGHAVVHLAMTVSDAGSWRHKSGF